MKENKKKEMYKSYRQIGLVGTIPMMMAAGPAIGYFLGSYLDKKLGTEPYLLLLMLVLGFVASGKETWNLIKKAQESTDNK
ncbi:MAG: AtpZ/AtpI family protein [candidate division Zixibacteria bacterium]|nr:AtpZ/AtpI family protein [candidate division Zixibacteria bacterium]